MKLALKNDNIHYFMYFINSLYNYIFVEVEGSRAKFEISDIVPATSAAKIAKLLSKAKLHPQGVMSFQ